MPKFTADVGYGIGFGATVALCGFRSVFGTFRVVVGHVIRKLMPKFTADVDYGIGFGATVALCGFRSIFGTFRVTVRHVIRKLVSERSAVFKSFRSRFAALARVIISRPF